jgi:hypothetical protein
MLVGLCVYGAHEDDPETTELSSKDQVKHM